MIPERRTSRLSVGHGEGFSLIEVVIAVSILGTAVLGLFYAQHAFHSGNGEAAEQTTALGLANELREMTLTLPLIDPINPTGTFGPESDETEVAHYDDVDDFDGPGGSGITFHPPIDAGGLAIDEMGGWSQTIVVESVNPSDLSGAAVADGSTELMRITVTVSRQTADGGWREATRLTWLRSPSQ